ncbi:hypothetical protein KEF85_00080 [Methylomonas paludis]|uniref:Glycosyltransferase 2-like domain-containing protein n=1 Tax=Methylomonas paludis TaxID=1173101 RepID=A0A975MNA4_9GAMM|nr:hypothetical protein [Methylomonas paludis]QWF70942.1 hypothetical protein KEF85_00080 [Methylomonas paludis]
MMHKLNISLQLSYLKINNKFGKSYGITQLNEPNIVISLTTYKDRINIAYLTVETLMLQSRKPDKIVLWLAKEDCSPANIPIELRRLENRGLQIEYVDRNIGPYKKLIYALSSFPNSTIITCDDDALYPQNFLENLYQASLKFRSEIIGYRCNLIKCYKQSLLPYLQWTTPVGKGPSYNLFPTGFGGILYPPNALHKEVLNINNFLHMAPTADDVWFKAMALLNDRKTVMVYDHSMEFPAIPDSQDNALWKINTISNQNYGNNGLCKNDLQIKKVFDYYDLVKKLK